MQCVQREKDKYTCASVCLYFFTVYINFKPVILLNLHRGLVPAGKSYYLCSEIFHFHYCLDTKNFNHPFSSWQIDKKCMYTFIVQICLATLYNLMVSCCRSDLKGRGLQQLTSYSCSKQVLHMKYN